MHIIALWGHSQIVHSLEEGGDHQLAAVLASAALYVYILLCDWGLTQTQFKTQRHSIVIKQVKPGFTNYQSRGLAKLSWNLFFEKSEILKNFEIFEILPKISKMPLVFKELGENQNCLRS